MTLGPRKMGLSGGRHRMMLCKLYIEPSRGPVSLHDRARKLPHSSKQANRNFLPPKSRMSKATHTEMYEFDLVDYRSSSTESIRPHS